MATVNLALFKQHVRADEFADDDQYLQHLLDAAKDSVIMATNRTEAELTKLGENGELPTPIQQAILMLGAHWYNQRESVSTTQMHSVPDSLQAIIKPYRKLVDDESRGDEVQT